MIPARRLRAVLLGALVAIAVTGCVAVEPQPDPADPKQLQVLTGWTSGPDQRALSDLLEVFSDAAPGILVFDESIAARPGMVDEVLSSRIAAGNAPDSAAVSVGSSLRSRIDVGELQDLTELLADERLPLTFNEQILDLVGVDGRIYGVPVGIRRVNVVWSNSAVLRDAGVDAEHGARDLDAWLADLEAVRRSGVQSPLAMGDSTTQVQLFESVLIADLGGPAYRDLWLRADAWRNPDLAIAIDHFGRLLDYTDQTTRTMSADELVNLVDHGDAGYAVLADASLATLQHAGYVEGRFRAERFPGTDGVFDLTADAFVLPTGAGHADSAVAWLRVVASVDGQEAFAAGRGGIPARIDAGGAFVTPYQEDAKWSYDRELLVPSLAGGVAADPAWTDAIEDAVTRFVRDGRAEVLRNALLAASVAAPPVGASQVNAPPSTPEG